jgi:hypothetical protein
MNIYILILILLYTLGLGFLLGIYYSDSTEPFERTEAESPFVKILYFLFSPLIAIIWLFTWIKRVFFGLDEK